MTHVKPALPAGSQTAWYADPNARPRRKKFPLNPAHPERTCWGCDRYCAASEMLCGNGSERSQHPAELFGPDWAEWLPPEEGGGAPPDHASDSSTG